MTHSDRMNNTDAFVLHRRPFRESSALVQLLSCRYGKLSAVVRVTKDSRGLLQPFIPLQLNLTGRSALKTASRLEAQSLAFPLFGEALYSGFYLNELLYYLLPEEEPVPTIYQAYQQALLELSANSWPLAAILRQFELTLLTQLGYGLPSVDMLETNQHYQFVPGEGFIDCVPLKTTFSGKALQALSAFNRDDAAQLSVAKRVFRIMLDELLAGHKLRSRELLIQHRAIQRED
ncbi:DNA repair protein RecO [Celerinatantimonas yamalensis]|uniref:DNA repair protein RecO n=1 Tax=Celerinatantimonas yamalensis TaxID=559956 RepID=A0ABW9G7U0_9GAMM